MMVHKESLGVLVRITVSPDDPGAKMMTVPATPDNLARYGIELALDEWWVVPNGSVLATKIKRCYPDFTPCTDPQGNLVNVIDHRLQRYHAERRRQKEEAEARLKKQREETAQRGYRRPLTKTRVQPGSMRFLHKTLRESIDKKD